MSLTDAMYIPNGDTQYYEADNHYRADKQQDILPR